MPSPTVRSLWTLVAFVVSSALASAQVVTHTVPITTPSLGAPYSTTFTVPKFDPAIGHLTQVEVRFSGTASGSIGMENLDTSPTVITVLLGVTVSITVDNFGWLSSPGYVVNQLPLSAFDGTLDFGGTSGALHSFTGAPGGPPSTITFTSPFDVDDFRGFEGAPGTKTFTLNAGRFLGGATFPVDLIGAIAFDGVFEVKYFYETSPTAFCSGTSNSVWGSCPCGNFGAPLHGCANSVDANGAALTASGASSITGDTLVLATSGMPNSNAIFLQGNDLADPLTVFGDGLRCIDGSLIRLGTSAIAGGSASYPSPVQLPVSVRAGIAAPGMRYYQTYYRNAAAFCTPATFNVSNALAVHWAP
ncbi:MAG: choice-of-anchor E domain-containing protein [Planctomycetes bacterium]|nr:choice-of-anchor E domain-containing protein [Planctomycetota bacterium]